MRHQMRSRGSILLIFSAQTWRHPAPTRASLPFSSSLPLWQPGQYCYITTTLGSRTKLNGAVWPVAPSPVCFRPALDLVLELTRMPHYLLRRAISLQHSFWCYSGPANA
ncbi:hypothetical protein CMUS01_00992 [Colletotrichum musicola]|uniref:Uncharacterized protein n=1 Tax=Colletotrichum musicola TaxID=2175873 RepID=A0A8H6U8G6_9PEZI|nr:hypothetical protein CMUS01_00992 [Colletotrichum musicola]